jgi:hypothetical protein
MRSVTFCTAHEILLGKSMQGGWVGHAARIGEEEICKVSWWGKLKKKHFEQLCIDERMILECI